MCHQTYLETSNLSYAEPKWLAQCATADHVPQLGAHGQGQEGQESTVLCMRRLGHSLAGIQD